MKHESRYKLWLRWFVGGTALAASAFSLACGGDGITGPVPVASVSVAIASPSVAVGAKTQATATVKDDDGNALDGRTVTWTSSDTEVASVSSTGEVTALRAGTAEIRATSEGKQGSATVTVMPPAIHAITVVIANPALQPGATTQASAVAKDASGNDLTGRPIMWSTDNAEVATVSTQGVVTGVKAGTATITATSEGKSGSATVTVSANVSEVVVTLPQPGLSVGFNLQAAATVEDASGNPVQGQPVTWSSSNTAVATVSESGVVTGVARGNADIIATSSGKSGSASIGVVVITPQSLSAGSSHTCAIATDGDTYCWGHNNQAQLGNGSTTSSAVPVRVAGGIKFKAVSASFVLTYALAENGQLYCWSLCPGSNTQVLTPQPWPTAVAAEVVEAGDGGAVSTAPTCVLGGETAYCWGGNLHGQLGRGTRGQAHVVYPEGPVAGNHAFADIGSRSDNHVCAITTAGTAYCWGGGRSGERGALGAGAGAAKESLVPQAVSGNLVFKDIAVGHQHNCALTTAGQAWCWGDNGYGQLGAATEGCPWGGSCSAIPVAVTGGHVFESIDVGGNQSCGLKASGEIYCWGQFFESVPIPFGGGVTYRSLSVGSGHACAVSTDGDAYCRGENYFGELGNGTSGTTTLTREPTKVVGGIKFRVP